MRFRHVRALAPVLLMLLSGATRLAAQAPRNEEFPYAIGAGGFALSDTGNASNVKAFSTGGFQAFGELVLGSGILFQARYQTFMLPGTPPVATPFSPAAPRGAPRVGVDAGALSIGYIFREAWWDAGFVAGAGIYRLKPGQPGVDQASTDISETIVGWHGGAVVIFQVASRLDLRVEATGYILQSKATHKPVELGASLAYHF